jgi:hypothetical protein
MAKDTVRYVEFLGVSKGGEVSSWDTLELPRRIAEKARELVAQMNLPGRLVGDVPPFEELRRREGFERSGDPVLELQTLLRPFAPTRRNVPADGRRLGFGSIL